jgi:hypothetical protein
MSKNSEPVPLYLFITRRAINIDLQERRARRLQFDRLFKELFK